MTVAVMSWCKSKRTKLKARKLSLYDVEKGSVCEQTGHGGKEISHLMNIISYIDEQTSSTTTIHTSRPHRSSLFFFAPETGLPLHHLSTARANRASNGNAWSDLTCTLANSCQWRYKSPSPAKPSCLIVQEVPSSRWDWSSLPRTIPQVFKGFLLCRLLRCMLPARTRARERHQGHANGNSQILPR